MGIWVTNRDVITKWVHFAVFCKRFSPFGTSATERLWINQYIVQQVAQSVYTNVLSVHYLERETTCFGPSHIWNIG